MTTSTLADPLHQRTKRQKLDSLTAEERRERLREQNKRACARRRERKIALARGEEIIPLLSTKSADDKERQERHAARERRRRAELGETYLASERERNKRRAMDPRYWEARSRYYHANKAAIIASVVDWQARNPDKVRDYAVTRYQRHKDRLGTDSDYAERLALQRHEWHRQRYQHDPGYRFDKQLLSSFRQAILQDVKTNEKVMTFVGCGIAELKLYLEARFRAGMCWENYRSAWEVDHIKPRAMFDFTDLEQVGECWYYTNLQPLFSWENREKGDRLDWVLEELDYACDTLS